MTNLDGVLKSRDIILPTKIHTVKTIVFPVVMHGGESWTIKKAVVVGGLVAKSWPTLCDPMDCGMPGLPVFHYLPEFAQTHVHWVSDSIQPSHHLLPPSLLALNLSQHQVCLFVCSELALCTSWPNYWSFSFSTSPSSQSFQSGLISFRIDWFDLLAVQGTLKNLLQHHSSKALILWC